MPTIPLYVQPSHADAAHRVVAPGGYEWWHFDAEDAQQDLQIVGIFFQGCVFHPSYLRRYARYLRRPTRHSPPLPQEYPSVYLAVGQAGRIAGQLMTQHPPREFSALHDRFRVQIGKNVAVQDDDGTYHLSTTSPDRALDVDLRFQPLLRHPPMQRRLVCREMSASEHQWIIAAPLCSVRGRIGICGRQIDFTGRGYHDHHFGTAPLGLGLKRWIRGRVLLDNVAYTFHIVQPSGMSAADEIHLIEADSGGFRQIPLAAVDADWSRMTALLLRYPDAMVFGDVLQLVHSRIIDSSPFCLRLRYEAMCRGRRAEALCEVAYPRRLRWPVLGRMIELSINKHPLREVASQTSFSPA